MTRTLLLRLAGPQQSWGTSAIGDRNTESVPTRSGILGLLAGTLGAERGHWPDWLGGVEAWARVDRPGLIESDFHVVSPPHESLTEARSRHLAIVTGSKTVSKVDHIVLLGSGGKWSPLKTGRLVSQTSHRQYLADAEFIVGITHPDEDSLNDLVAAVQNPVFDTYLGRKSFPPAFPFRLGLRDGAPADVLSTLPSLAEPGELSVHQLTGGRNLRDRFVNPSRISSYIEWKNS